ncbi:MAG: leucine-rich repeat domain-containing protein, partial [Treponema sp.]|nr:leucine-rich repeat domain-containing protein [Treponema sp.]
MFAACGDAEGGPAGPAVYYTVSYNAGVGGAAAPSSQTVRAGTAITLPQKGSMTQSENRALITWKSGGLCYGAGASYTVTADATFTAQWSQTLSEIAALLTNAPGGASAADPVPLAITVDIGINSGMALIDVLQSAGKYVALDLSACSMTGMNGVFDADDTVSTGKDKIVSLILPDTAQGIQRGDTYNPTFKHFTALTEISGRNVTAIGDWAFADCTAALTTVSFPKATSVGILAF